ncbi:methyltransferase domain-containing protein [Nocardioides terrae]|nr:methyltransferase domain-containing protein [Nocardioides terrae]
MTTTPPTTRYVLGHSDTELARLHAQARMLAGATGAFFTLSGIAPGMRVLDLGSGAGDVAFLLAGRVGPSGSVLGVDSSETAVAFARDRARREGIGDVEFVVGDVRSLDVGDGFDAVVGRLILLYVDDPADVVRSAAELLRPGGVLLMMEYEMEAIASLPPHPLVTQIGRWLTGAFRHVGRDPVLGARLHDVLLRAGLDEPIALGLQAYFGHEDRRGARLGAETVRSMLPVIVSSGLATEQEIGIETLEQRLFDALASVEGILRIPTLVGAWGRVA